MYQSVHNSEAEDFRERRNHKKAAPEQLIGLYQRVWNSREGVELIIRGAEEGSDIVNTKAITCAQLINFMRSNGYITTLDNSNTRFVRTELPMPKARSHRDIKRLMKGNESSDKKRKRSGRRRHIAKKKRSHLN